MILKSENNFLSSVRRPCSELSARTASPSARALRVARPGAAYPLPRSRSLALGLSPSLTRMSSAFCKSGSQGLWSEVQLPSKVFTALPGLASASLHIPVSRQVPRLTSPMSWLSYVDSSMMAVLAGVR